MIDLVLVTLFQLAAGEATPPTESVTVTAPPAAEQPAAQTPAATPATEQLRCRREMITGTRLSRRICTTRAEDLELQDESRDAINRIQSMSPGRSN